ncbi:receptor-like protein 1 [Cocos nucifera]|uniref:Receptor-like protein 1 n=1 Tax=Cocos nucifera TaxID=13894 RepID=A0A8K0MVN8_COCNU|nr:receptor-like protein 1 [Cocos nucifera]
MKGSVPPRIFAGLVSLQHLDLSHNLFDGHFSFSSLANLSRLEYIDLSNNEELFIHLDSGKFLPSFRPRSLILSHCNLDVNPLARPAFLASQYKLEALDLSHNNLKGNFPTWLFKNLTRLAYLNLRNCSIMGPFQFPNHLNTSMSIVDLSMNFLSGSIPTDIGTIFPNMTALNLSSNYLTGNIPSSLGNMSNLLFLDLSNNNLSGEVPNSLMIDCTELSFLKLSNNNLHGKLLGTNHSHASLVAIFLDGNKFTGTLGSFLSQQQQLQILDVHDNQFWGTIPDSIGLVSDLLILNLAGNHFHGPIPHHLCNLTFLEMLDLSNNLLSGSLPHCFQSSELVLLNFARNAITGTIPSSYFNNSYLAALDVSNNQLSGKLPKQIGENMPLEILLLSENSLEGSIPIELCKLQPLHVLDLSHNNLSGSIPSCFAKMHFRKPDSIDADFFGFVVTWYFASYPNEEAHTHAIMMVDFITKANLYAYSTDDLHSMFGIDLSANKLTGSIPPEIGNLDELVQLNLSYNQLIGPIPETFSKLNQIESLDVSHNQLSGTIPRQLTQLESLEVFSVAYNNLSGCTPDFKYQFATFDNRSYEGNVRLHGPPLEKTCTSASSPIGPPHQEDGNVEDDAIFFAILAVSFIAGFWGCVAFLSCHHTGQHIRIILDAHVDSLTERILMAAHKRTCMLQNRR